MKILSIAFKNINSLKGENYIDFEAPPFSGNTLFAITGPTGSGKSSILDVISLALFNQVPRLGKITKKEIREKGAILTRNQKQAYAKVTYQTNAGRFTSSWSIEVNRNGNLNDYNMEIANLQDNSLLDLKKSEVPSKNEDLIGLNYDQFIKSVLLAQGDFAKFLSAKKEERGELLEKITGTGIYRQLGILAFERFRAETAEIETQQNEIKLINSYLLSNEDQKSLQNDLKEKSAQAESLNNDLKLIEKQLEQKEIIRNQEKEINSLEEKKIALNIQLKEFENAYGDSLRNHEKVQAIAEELQAWKRYQLELSDFKAGINKTCEKIKLNKENSKHFIQKVKNFIHQELSAENLREKLQTFTDEILKLQENKKSLGLHYKSQLQLFKTEIRQLNLDFPENNLRAGKKILEDLKADKEHQKQQLEINLKEIDLKNLVREKNRLKTELEKSRQAQKFSDKNLNHTENRLRLQKEVEGFQTDLKRLPEIIQKEKNSVVFLKKELEILQLKKENQLISSKLEELRSSLKAGEACPLCGSTEHPYSSHLPDFENDLALKISAKTIEIDQHTTELTQAQSKLVHLEDSLRKSNSEIGKIEEEITRNNDNFKIKFPEFESLDSVNWESHILRLNSKIENIESFETLTQQLKAIATGLPILGELEEILKRGKLLQQKLEKQYSGKNIGEESRQLIEGWNSLMQEKKYLQQDEKDQKQLLEQKLNNYNELLERLEKQLIKFDFESIEKAYQSLLPGDKFFRLKKEKDNFLNQKNTIETGISTLKKQLEQFKEHESGKSIEDLNSEQKQKLEIFQMKQSKCEEMRRKLANNNEYLSRLKDLNHQIAAKEKQCKRWRLLNTLIGDSQGKKFNDFAQDLTLIQLIYLANIRLKDLSRRYKIDKAMDGEDDGLVAIDEDMGGQRRSVKTLSGGETFLLSLSLALALSDLASRNVEINSLFIDEGFGTLDPETLDQTLDTLEKLQAESGKTIGIISHVASLKERITIQIQLSLNGQGYSSFVVK